MPTQCLLNTKRWLPFYKIGDCVRQALRATEEGGELLSGWLDELDVSVTGFADHIGISRVMLSRVLNARSSVSADMDLRLAEVLGTSPGYWLALQAQRDLWTARLTAKERKKITRMAAPELEAA
jgi:addiction module HigA family antidote